MYGRAGTTYRPVNGNGEGKSTRKENGKWLGKSVARYAVMMVVGGLSTRVRHHIAKQKECTCARNATRSRVEKPKESSSKPVSVQCAVSEK